MEELKLTGEIIYKVQTEIVPLVNKALGKDLRKCLLYGSCARGDYTKDSDIDIALLVNCDRMEAKKYADKLADIASEMAMRYFAIVNFVCIPYEEYTKKKSWYLYFKNISEEGVLLCG